MHRFRSGLVIAVLMLVSCATPPTGESYSLDSSSLSTGVSAAAAPNKAELLLSEGMALYEKGDFKAAIRKLTGARDAFADRSEGMQKSLKYLAFSYCVSGQRGACQAQFASLIDMAPNFQLGRAEAGHPQWGPVFRAARASAQAANPTAASAVR